MARRLLEYGEASKLDLIFGPSIYYTYSLKIAGKGLTPSYR
jgi:hypothetical protein